MIELGLVTALILGAAIVAQVCFELDSRADAKYRPDGYKLPWRPPYRYKKVKGYLLRW